MLCALRTAVIGHIEWVEFALVSRVPRQGEIVNARSSFAEPAGGGAVAAVQLARLAEECVLYTALGDDDLGRRTIARLTELGVRVEAAIRRGRPTRRAFTFLDDDGERTITTLGDRLHPTLDDRLDWAQLEDTDAVYFVAGDVAALRRARAARAVVATARVMPTLAGAGVELDAVVGSASDGSERYTPIDPPPRFVVATAGSRGGSWIGAEGRNGRWAATPAPGPLRDAYGAGDSFAAGLAFALGRGDDIDAALALGARCGATCMTGRGPYEHQLSRDQLAR
jgi:ribokinase